ncbi:MAG: DNA-deoxyinosine glycosylase [Clostridia bacterium]|nr:DNA-deoxyinosine glycosylase [Clostridia bacterium]
MAHLEHPIPPLWRPDSRILILGSFPSPKSREQAFFYGHPQNRFWRVLAAVWETDVPRTVEEKTAFLCDRHLALWDVIASCEIEGASDASVRDAVPNDLAPILRGAPISAICTTGGTAHRLYTRLIAPITGRPAIALPSTSPANARMSLDALVDAYRIPRTL